MTNSTPGTLESRVVVVDDHVMFGQIVELALTRQGFNATRLDLEAQDRDLVSVLLDDPPDLLLVDLDLGPYGDGQALIGPTTEAGVDVVVVTGSERSAEWASAVQAGALAVMSKSRPLADLVSAVHKLLAGEALMGERERQDLLDEWCRPEGDHAVERARFDTLTATEARLIGMLIRGWSVTGAAGHLGVDPETARAVVDSLVGKLQVSSDLEAIGMAHVVGWQPPVTG